MSNDLHWNPKESHKPENIPSITKTLLTGKPGDIITSRKGKTYRVRKDGSFKKL